MLAAAPWIVSDELWELLELLLPRKERRFRYPGHKRLPDRQPWQGILLVLPSLANCTRDRLQPRTSAIEWSADDPVLVGTDGGIDWYCCPRFDDWPKQLYLPDSPTRSSIATTWMSRRTGSRGTRGRSRSARTGTWRRSRAQAGSTRARLAFEKMLTYTNHLGLYAEEIGQTREVWGLPAGVHACGADQRGALPEPGSEQPGWDW